MNNVDLHDLDARLSDSYYQAYYDLRLVLLDIRDALISGERLMPIVARGLEITPAHWEETHDNGH